MRLLTIMLMGCVACVAVGCQTSPSWNHPSIQDPGLRASRLSKDDTECTLFAEQYSAGIPVTVPNTSQSLPQSFSGTVRSFNSQTGATTFSTYSGQSGGPSGGFAGGFASGLGSGAALGQAIRAARIQDLAYKHCMTSRGWVDSKDKSLSPASKEIVQDKTTIESPEPYPDAQATWKADCEEFWRFFPEYRSGPKYEALNERVKALAKAKSLEGPQYLVEALELIDPEKLKLSIRDSEDALELYLKAVRGNARAQAGLGLAYVQKQDSRTPLDPARSAYWSRKSALAGNPIGQMGYGILLFSGGATGSPNRVAGYRWVQKAGETGANVQSTLLGFEEGMTKAELGQVKR